MNMEENDRFFQSIRSDVEITGVNTRKLLQDLHEILPEDANLTTILCSTNEKLDSRERTRLVHRVTMWAASQTGLVRALFVDGMVNFGRNWSTERRTMWKDRIDKGPDPIETKETSSKDSDKEDQERLVSALIQENDALRRDLEIKTQECEQCKKTMVEEQKKLRMSWDELNKSREMFADECRSFKK